MRQARKPAILRCPPRRGAAGVMMIPIPREGIYVDVEGLEHARSEPGIEDVIVTAKQGQKLVPITGRRELSGLHFCARRNTGGRRATRYERAHREVAL